MPAIPETFAWEDAIMLRLRGLYETYGYSQYRMGKFEPYDMYRENRNFLISDTVITFTDASGRLMALKPDVTMSIVKNTQPETRRQKLYYNENVFRTAPGTREYREIRQIGLEYIGCSGGYAEAETVLLAMKSLETVSPDYLLSVSHMGLISAIMEQCGLCGAHAERALEALRHKNSHELVGLAAAAGLNDGQKALLRTAAAISDPVPAAAEKLRAAGLSGTAASALGELEQMETVLEAAGYAGHMLMDFTVVNDMDYYNGVVFQGYIQGIPRAVLSGGRYDNLMHRFGKDQPALGFALYIGELARFSDRGRAYDADILLVYGDTEPAAVMRAVDRLLAEGYSVFTAAEADNSVTVKEIRRLTPDGQEVSG